MSSIPGSPWGFIKGQIRAVAGQEADIYKAVEAGQAILADT